MAYTSKSQMIAAAEILGRYPVEADLVEEVGGLSPLHLARMSRDASYAFVASLVGPGDTTYHHGQEVTVTSLQRLADKLRAELDR